MHGQWLNFKTSDFLESFGAPHSEFNLISDEVAKYDFQYRKLSQAERDDAILTILQRLDGFSKVGAHRHQIWTDSWEETRQRYLNSEKSIEALDPPFMGATPIVRLGGDYVLPKISGFEVYWYRVFRQWIFKKFLSSAPRVFEFGCGSGFNLATLGTMYPDKELVGFDWAQPAVDLVNQIGIDHTMNLTGRRFDFFEIDKSIPVGPGVAVATFCALEQTGTRYDGFVDWMMAARPDVVVSMEPAIENYQVDDLHDYLAYAFHKRREYLDGYFSAVRAAAVEGKAEILFDHRPRFGSFFHEGYSLLVWRPV
jgi:hypothetical protein